VNENCADGPTIPEFHPSTFDVDVWATESVFVHVTVVPAATVMSSGEKARFPSADAPAGLTIDDEDPPAGGVGDGSGDGEGEGVE
jgi:hypothetical protein